jgi:hypothetical protein
MYWREDIPEIDGRERKKEKDRMRRERQSDKCRQGKRDIKRDAKETR